MSSRQNPLLHVTSCYYHTAFEGALSLSRVFWKSACSRPNKKPKSISKQVKLGHGWRHCFVGFRCFGTISCLFLSFCMRLLSFSFHYPLICLHFFLSYFSNVHSRPLIFLSFAYIRMQFPCILYSCPFISVLRFWKGLYGLARGRNATNDYR